MQQSLFCVATLLSVKCLFLERGDDSKCAVIALCLPICSAEVTFITGVDYGSYTLSLLIFPMLQQWIRRETADSEANLKQAIGLFTEVAVTYINTTQGQHYVTFLTENTHEEFFYEVYSGEKYG